MNLQFYGAAGEVTGSCHILECQGHKVLVDCGLIQGGGDERRRNRAPFPFQASDIDAVILTHAHIDHSGRLPLLVRRGFRGPIYTQRASEALADILLRDSAHLQEYDAERMSRKRKEQGKARVKPLYDLEDAERAIKHIEGVRYREWVTVSPGVRCRYWDAGHILGSASVEVELEENGVKRCIVFSGDLGQYDSPILRDPVTPPVQADWVVMETTYGGRAHRDRDATLTEMGEILETVVQEGGNIVIPAFAIGRSQELLYHLAKNFDEWGVERFQIFLDSPLAIEATRIYWDFPQLYDEEASLLRIEDREAPILPNLHMTRTAEESIAINEIKSGAIIIAGSGMCTGGRIVHHLRHRLGKPNTHVLFTGYQAFGTLGRRLIDGLPSVRLYGDEIKVNAKVHTLGGFSAHGDQADLLRWLQAFDSKPEVFLVHGEEEATQAFEEFLHQKTQLKVKIPQPGQTYTL